MRRGVCPTLAQPMPTGDGLLVRFRPIGSSLSVKAFADVARAAARHGNGLIEITARGSLQVRGLWPATHRKFADAVTGLVAVERGVPVETPSLAGLDPAENADALGLADRLRHAIAAEGLSLRLSPKVTVMVDASGALDRLGADVRLRAIADGWRLSLGGTVRGVFEEDGIVAATLSALETIARQGPAARARDRAEATALAPLGRYALRDNRNAFGLALAFGSVEADALLAFLEFASEAGAEEIRLSPGRGFYLIGPSALDLAALRNAARSHGFITDASDPRSGIAACAGRDGCASGHIATRVLAAELAIAAPALFDGSFTLHVSGCAKGCAHPRSAALTLVGDAAGCGLVVAGAARDHSIAHLPPECLAAGFVHLERLFLAGRYAQESASAWLGRLGPRELAAAFEQGQG